jgi:glycosyltransferase involved in cell wall biosynthesis
VSRREGITVVVPVHPPRFHTTLDRALRSVWEQTLAPDAVVVTVDHDHAGAAATRNRGLLQVATEWTAFLDSDDQLMPDHLEQLTAHQRATGADLVFPYGTVVGGWDPFAAYEGKPFDPVELETFNRIPVTVLARTSLLVAAGGFRPKGPPENPCDDWACWEALVAAGGTISHLNRRTWYYHHGGGNTSGRGDVW